METLRILAFVAAVGACPVGLTCAGADPLYYAIQHRHRRDRRTGFAWRRHLRRLRRAYADRIQLWRCPRTPAADGYWGSMERNGAVYLRRGQRRVRPQLGSVVGAGGVLYGSTSEGGAYGGGTFYELQPPASPGETWTESVLYSFGAPGVYFGAPTSEVIPGPSGSILLSDRGLQRRGPGPNAASRRARRSLDRDLAVQLYRGRRVARPCGGPPWSSLTVPPPTAGQRQGN